MPSTPMQTIIKEDAARIAAALSDSVHSLEGTTLLVTGGAGFLCGYLVDVLVALNSDILRKPVKLIVVDNFLRGEKNRLAHLADDPNVRLIARDVTQPYEGDDRPDWIIHGASVASPTYYRIHPLETIDVNVNGTRHMLDLAKRADARSVIVLSSSEIYGDPDPAFIPTPEDYRGNVSCTGPRACYDESKRLSETLAVGYHDKHKVPVKIIRPFNVYGPGQRLDDKRIVPDLVSSGLRGEPIVLYSDGRATRSFCYASDFIAGMLIVMLRGQDGEPYNVGNDAEISIREVSQTVARIASDPPLAVEFRVSQDPHYLTDNPQRRCPDLSKLRALGYAPAIGLEEGLRRTMRSYGWTERETA